MVGSTPDRTGMVAVARPARKKRVHGGPRVAMISVGLGRLQRGFERYLGDLFELLRDRVDITLYKGGGDRSEQERVPRLLTPMSWLARALPMGGLAGGADYAQYRHDCAAYALSIIPELLREEYDVIHVIDPPLVKALQRLLRMFRISSTLLFTEGTVMPPPLYPTPAHIHHVGEAAFREAANMGVPEAGMTLVPCGIDPSKFFPADDREELRRKYGVASGAFVVVVVSALRRMHKRVHHIIDEVSRLDGEVLLWLDGSMEDPQIAQLAQRKLGARCRITHVASDAVPELFRLADVMAHGATEESFGLAITEAMACGLPVLVHESPHFEWLTGDGECLADMRYEGRLEAAIRTMRAHWPEYRARALRRAAAVHARFGWDALAPAYEAMYQKVVNRGYEPAIGKAALAKGQH